MSDDFRPPLTFQQIILMNFGFFGIQYSFGMQQTAINPIFSFLHADPQWASSPRDAPAAERTTAAASAEKP